MTITEYRNILFEKIDKTEGGVAKGLEEALELSESLYDSYDEENYALYMTNGELAEMLAKGYGQVTLIGLDYEEYGTEHNDASIDTYWSYSNNEDDKEVPENVRVRAWRSGVWTEPTTSLYNSWKMGTLVSFEEN